MQLKDHPFKTSKKRTPPPPPMKTSTLLGQTLIGAMPCLLSPPPTPRLCTRLQPRTPPHSQWMVPYTVEVKVQESQEITQLCTSSMPPLVA